MDNRAQGNLPRDTEGTPNTMTAATAETVTPAAKRGRKSKDEIAALPELDLSALEVKTGVEMPSRKRQTADNPFVQHVKDSYEYDDARAVTVASANAKRVVSLIRRAADSLSTPDQGVGVSIFEEVNGDQTTITFAARERRARKTKEETAESE